MTQITVDASKCAHDGLCARVCPGGVLCVHPDRPPEVDPVATCIACGHCASVCPHGAIALDGVGGEALDPLPRGWRLDGERVGQLLRGRRSTRAFREESLTRQTLAALIELASHAPSGRNSQPLAWTVIEDRVAVRAVAEATICWLRSCLAKGAPLAGGLGAERLVSRWDAGQDPICRSAPHLVVAHADAEVTYESSKVSGAIAITYLDLAAVSLGAGTCWAGYVGAAAEASSAVHAMLGVPVGRRACAISMVGRPAVVHLRVPRRNPPSIAWR
jgi:nitroreductase/NAD-dependent dihydropyrimidine dehydrogenase PreA subunit